jgi:hypothetical protein
VIRVRLNSFVNDIFVNYSRWAAARERLRTTCKASLLMIIVAGLLAACTVGGRPSPTPPTSPQVEREPLEHLAGVYAVTSRKALKPAAKAGARVIMESYSPENASFNNATRENGLHVIDTWIQQRLYHAYCPSGLSSCHTPGSRAQRALMRTVKQHVTATASSGLVLGYYLTDDYWVRMAGLLKQVYQVIRTHDLRRPTICGLSVPLEYSPRSANAPRRSTSQFRHSLRNYSPHWCNAVMLYSYGPIEPKRPMHSSDWLMTRTLPKALELLRRAGWDADKEPLIGVPQAFGYNPRTGVRGSRLNSPQYLLSPSPKELANQIEAFCAAGARSIIAYAWNDGSTGRVSELYNSPGLRRGYDLGVDRCRQRYWN